MIRRAAPLALGLFAWSLVPLVPGVAHAQTTQEGAQALEQRVHDWLLNTFGPDARVSQRPLQVTAAGDHYDLSAPIGDGANPPRWTATATEQSGGRYAIDGASFPSPAEFTVKLPDPATGQTRELTYTVSVGNQTSHMLLDPSYATTTTGASSVEHVTVASVGGPVPLTSSIESGNLGVIMQPDTAGRLDMALETTLANYAVESQTADDAKLRIVFGKVHATGTATSVARERAATVIQALIKLGRAASPAPGATEPAVTPAQSAAVILAAIDGLATGAAADETFEDLGVTANGISGALHSMQIGFGIKGVDGLIQAHMDLAAAGLTLPDLGLGTAAELIPTKISLRPVIGGVPGEALLALARASNAGQSPSPDDVMALFARGPVTAGLDSMTVAVGGAEFTGTGKFAVASPQDFSGSAQVTATNLDLLQQRVAAEPNLAQAGPAIIFLKGIGRSVGNQMIWDVVYDGGRVLVNNQDLSALIGGPPPAAPPPVAPAPAPHRPPADNGRPQLRRRQ